MIRKFTMGAPIETQAVVKEFVSEEIGSFPFDYKVENGKFIFGFDMQKNDIEQMKKFL